VEVCSLRDVARSFEELGAVVYGLSTDDVKSQAQFVKQQELNFQLLSDPDGSMASKYDILWRGAYTKRVTFVIDPKGVLRAIDDAVKVRQHGQDLVDLLTRLQAE